uniref:Uncharacterized protein n=1 Tax=Octopus bimaculoides TaxID=37653 RepID=A0A0L8GNJ8_OCTBM
MYVYTHTHIYTSLDLSTANKGIYMKSLDLLNTDSKFFSINSLPPLNVRVSHVSDLNPGEVKGCGVSDVECINYN